MDPRISLDFCDPAAVRRFIATRNAARVPLSPYGDNRKAWEDDLRAMRRELGALVFEPLIWCGAARARGAAESARALRAECVDITHASDATRAAVLKNIASWPPDAAADGFKIFRKAAGSRWRPAAREAVHLHADAALKGLLDRVPERAAEPVRGPWCLSFGAHGGLRPPAPPAPLGAVRRESREPTPEGAGAWGAQPPARSSPAPRAELATVLLRDMVCRGQKRGGGNGDFPSLLVRRGKWPSARMLWAAPADAGADRAAAATAAVLLGAGADPGAPDPESPAGYTALHYAAKQGLVRTCAVLTAHSPAAAHAAARDYDATLRDIIEHPESARVGVVEKVARVEQGDLATPAGILRAQLCAADFWPAASGADTRELLAALLADLGGQRGRATTPV